MRHAFRSALTAAICALPLLAAPIAAEARPFTYHDMLVMNRVSDPQVSPDGRWVVYAVRATDMEANRGRTSLWLADLSGDAEPRRLAVSDEGANTGRWGPDGALYFLSSRSGSSQVWRTDAQGATATQVTDLPLDVQTFRLSPQGDRIAVSLAVIPSCPDLQCTVEALAEREARPSSGQLYEQLFVRHWDQWADGTRHHVFVQSLAGGVATGSPVAVMQGFDGDAPSRPFGDESEYVFTPDGQAIVFAARLAGRTEPWSTNFDLWRAPVTGGAAENLTPNNPAWDTAPTFSPDGRSMAYLAMSRAGFEADRYRIMVRDMATGAEREVAPDWDRSPGSLQWSDDGRRLYAVAPDVGQTRLFEIDARSGAVIPVTGPGHVAAYDLTPSGFVIARDALDSPVELYRKTFRGREMPIPITRHNDLSGLDFGEAEQFTFAGWNGETVHGYVIKPADYEEGREYPVAFLIHGGPQGSFGNSWSYRWNPQSYAGLGYAVVMIDFHGSVGYGQDFTDSISQHWGDRPLEDLQRGWAHAVATYDFLDEDRACALGASYGGYMVNWIAGNWSEPWSCLVNHDGVFDTRMMGFSTEELWFTEWENGGTPWDVPANYEAFNPANHVAKWDTPMLVIQGGLDFRIPTEQSLATFTALQRRGIESQLLYFPDENHWVLQPQNSLLWHQTVEAWLNRWLRPDEQ